MIQVRNVPESLHEELKRRAAKRGVTLTGYIQDILEREIARPPTEEVFERIAGRSSVDLGSSAVDLIRAERSGRA
jgi:plasmid stability protein